MTKGVVKSAARVLEILEHFADRRQASNVGEIAAALRYPQSSASVLLHSLEALGYLSYDAERRHFMPTARVALLGSWIELGLASGAVPRVLEQIHLETRETVILAIQNGVHAQYIQVLEAESPVRLHLKPGVRRPLVRCAVGWVLLACKSNADISRILRRCNSSEPPMRRMRERELLDIIDKVRRTGIAMTHGHMTEGAGVIAMMLPKMAHQPPMAVGIGAPIDRLEQKRKTILATLRASLDAERGLVGRVRERT